MFGNPQAPQVGKSDGWHCAPRPGSVSPSLDRSLTLQPLDLVGERLDALLAVVHLDVEGVVLESLGHGDLLVHVQLAQQLLLRGNQFLRRR